MDLNKRAEEAHIKLNSQEYEEAYRLVADAEAQIACWDRFVGADSLLDLYLVGAGASTETGQVQEAERLYAAAARVGGDIYPDNSHAPSVLQAFEDARRLVNSQPPGTFRAHESARVDGWELAVGQTLKVAPGEHLVQTYNPDGTVVSRMMAVQSDGIEEIGVPLDLCADCPIPPPCKCPNPRMGARLTGGALIALGTAALATDVMVASRLSEYPESAAPLGLANALLAGGLIAVGTGTVIAVGAGLGDATTVQLGLSGRF